MAAAGLVALLSAPRSPLLVAVLMLVGWFVDENILAPLVRAGALELHPIVVTFAFLLGAQLAGAIGAIVAIPLAAVVQAFVVKSFERYRTEHRWPAPGPTPAVAGPPPARRPHLTQPARVHCEHNGLRPLLDLYTDALGGEASVRGSGAGGHGRRFGARRPLTGCRSPLAVGSPGANTLFDCRSTRTARVASLEV